MNTNQDVQSGMDRRTFLKLSGGVLGALVLGHSSRAFAAEPDWVDVGNEADFPLNEPVFLKDQLAFVVRREAGWYGLSARCTHRGCTVSWSGTEFICPCHQARFDINGSVLAEPARDTLAVMPAKAVDGRVWLGL